jgi:ankyrin repeat protein
VNANTAAPDGATPLSWAVHWSNVNAVEQLIRAGANTNATNDYGVTPLWLACSNGNAPIVQRLLTAGATPNVERGGETPLMRCARSGSIPAVRALLARKAEVNGHEVEKGQTALMWAVAEKHPEVASLLIQGGADVKAQSKGGFTPLLFAARSGDLDSARTLVEHGANVNDASPDGMSAVLVASASGHEDVAILLVEHGADPNVTDPYGLTPLHYAVLRGLSIIRGIVYEPEMAYLLRADMPGLVSALLSHRANPNVRIAKEMPLVLRQRNRQYARIRGATPFLLAAAAGDANIMRLLAAGGADTKQSTSWGMTPLMAAAGVGQIYGNRTKEEAAHAMEAVKLAVEMGADVNATDSKGATAVQGAAYRGASDIIQFLVKGGARLDLMDKYGHTALGIAEGDLNVLRDERERRRYPKTAALIRSLGGDVPGTATNAASSTAAPNANPIPARPDVRVKDSSSGSSR